MWIIFIYLFIYLLFIHYNINVCFKDGIISLLVYPRTGFQPNRPSSDLPGQAKIINFPGNSQATLFARQVLQVSNQTCQCGDDTTRVFLVVAKRYVTGMTEACSSLTFITLNIPNQAAIHL